MRFSPRLDPGDHGMISAQNTLSTGSGNTHEGDIRVYPLKQEWRQETQNLVIVPGSIQVGQGNLLAANSEAGLFPGFGRGIIIVSVNNI